MKPVPHSRHVVAVLILAAFAALEGTLAFRDRRLSDEQVHVATAALKRSQTDLFALDGVYGSSGLWRLQSPVVQAYLELVLAPTGYRDPILPLRMLVGPVVLLYLCGMYALLFRYCQSWSAAAFVAVLSSAVTYTPGGEHWGVGSLDSITPSGMALALTPLVFLAYLRYERRWQLGLVFLGAGLLANLDLVTAMNLSLVLLAAYLGRRRFSLRALLVGAGCGLVALAAASPFLLYGLGLRHALSPGGAAASPAAVRFALKGMEVLYYPEALKRLLDWELLLRSAVLVVAAVAVLTRAERFRLRDLSVWLWTILGALVVGFGLHGASQLVGKALGTAPPVIDFLRASCLVTLPLYALLAHALTNLFRLAPGSRPFLRWGCAVLGVVWMLPADNLRVLRHGLYDAYGAVQARLDTSGEVRAPRRHELTRQRRDELAALADWVRRNTDPRAIFLTESIEFRLLSRRALAASLDDVRFYYSLAPERLEDWSRTVRELDDALNPPLGQAQGERLAALAAELARRRGAPEGTEGYAVLRSETGVSDFPGVREIEPAGWGRHYRLWRVR